VGLKVCDGMYMAAFLKRALGIGLHEDNQVY